MGQCKSILVVLGQWPVTVGKKDPMAPQRGVSPRTPHRRARVLARPDRRSGPMERPEYPADHVGDVEGANSPIVPPALAVPVGIEGVGGSNNNPPNQICTYHQTSEDRAVRVCHQIPADKDTIYFWLVFLVTSGTLLIGIQRYFGQFCRWLRARRAGGDVEAGGDQGDGGAGGDVEAGGDRGDGRAGGDRGDREAPSYFS